MKRRPVIAANWKMNLGSMTEARSFVRAIRPPLSHIDGVDSVICPPFTVLAGMAEMLRSSPIGLGAQNIHWDPGGAHTGEISAAMLAGLCQFVIVGHSERRATGSSSESDNSVNRKTHTALESRLTPIICVGEDLAHNEAGETDGVVGDQIESAFEDIPAECAGGCVVAYEPIWAIGSGRAATPVDANRTMGLTIRGRLAGLFGEEVASAMRILYGGSVTSANIADFMVMPEIDGALVGGASLDAQGFVDLVRNACT